MLLYVLAGWYLQQPVVVNGEERRFGASLSAAAGKVLLYNAAHPLSSLSSFRSRSDCRFRPRHSYALSTGDSRISSHSTIATLVDSPPKTWSYPSSSVHIPTLFSLRGGGGGAPEGEVSQLVEDAYGWCMNLGQPSALVAGAVIATMYENIANGVLDISPEDSRFTKFNKRVTMSLLLSAFALEVVAIFVTTVTGTMLMSRHLHDMDQVVPVTEHTTPLAFLRDNFEFEYLTARISFLQGLLNWISAIALEIVIPRNGETHDTRIMNKFIGSALFSIVALMLAFYNKHMTFYANYFVMLSHWFQSLTERFLSCWPPRPMAIIYVPAILSTLYWGYQSFFREETLGNGMSPKKEDKNYFLKLFKNST